jgi:carbon-monoxide dehydrogenase large subunit
MESFTRGKGKFVDDINLPDQLRMVIVRSPYARARIANIKGGINGNELKDSMSSVGEGATEGSQELQQPILSTTFVNYVGQPVAAVFGDDLYSAEDAAETVDVEYEPLKPVMTMEDALSSAPLHASAKSNLVVDKWLGKEFDIEAPVVIEDSFFNRRVATNPIETRGVVADYRDGRLTLWISTQSVSSIKEGICEVLHLEEDKVRVIQADTGGAFGLKGGIYPEYVIAAYASMKFGKPVKWIETRREHLTASNPGRGAMAKIKLFADSNGKVLGLKGEVMVDAGAYAGGMGEFAPGFIAYQLTGQYAIEKAHVRAMGVFTNKPPHGPYRGAGRPEAAFFMERMMDMLADKLKMDAAEIRLRNASTKPFKSPLGMSIDASKPFLENAIRELYYANKSVKEKAGFSCFVLVPATQPGESARIVIKEGRVKVWLGGNTHGQDHETFVRKLLKDELGLPEDHVELQRGDTDMMKSGVGSWGSRSAMMGGLALIVAARKIRDQTEKEFGKCTPEILLSNEYDEFHYEKYKSSLNSFGANLATVGVDRLGEVHVKEMWSYYDVGNALNREMVIGQTIGGMMQGIGQTLSEEIAYNEDGQLLTASISDAGLQTAKTIPKFVVKIAEERSSLPHGAKGLGESPTIGTPSALARAIERVSGKRIRETPVRPEMLLD